jgi:GMP synthase (glutamine-hydrolysing)
MRKLLYMDNQGDNLWPSAIGDLFSENGFEYHPVLASKNQFPDDLTPFQCIFLSGSVLSSADDLEWIHREHDLIRTAVEKNIPILGSCFGSQILASALCGKNQLFRRKTCEVGYKWIVLTDPTRLDPLLQNLDDKVYMFVWHNDEIRADHEDMVILGKSDVCPNHIWRFKNKPVWGIQGHPELNREQVIQVLDHYRDYFIRDHADMDGIKQQAVNNIESIKLIQNFIDFCKRET